MYLCVFLKLIFQIKHVFSPAASSELEYLLEHDQFYEKESKLQNTPQTH